MEVKIRSCQNIIENMTKHSEKKMCNNRSTRDTLEIEA